MDDVMDDDYYEVMQELDVGLIKATIFKIKEFYTVMLSGRNTPVVPSRSFGSFEKAQEFLYSASMSYLVDANEKLNRMIAIDGVKTDPAIIEGMRRLIPKYY